MLLRVTIDTMCINARAARRDLNRLEDLNRRGLIKLTTTPAIRMDLESDLTKYGEARRQKAARLPCAASGFMVGRSMVGGPDVIGGPDLYAHVDEISGNHCSGNSVGGYRWQHAARYFAPLGSSYVCLGHLRYGGSWRSRAGNAVVCQRHPSNDSARRTPRTRAPRNLVMQWPSVAALCQSPLTTACWRRRSLLRYFMDAVSARLMEAQGNSRAYAPMRDLL